MKKPKLPASYAKLARKMAIEFYRSLKRKGTDFDLMPTLARASMQKTQWSADLTDLVAAEITRMCGHSTKMKKRPKRKRKVNQDSAIISALVKKASSAWSPKLAQMAYQDFLKSEYWRLIRNIKLMQGKRTCQDCGSANTSLDIHHLTYSHRGCEHEFLSCLLVLCRPCHERRHKIHK